MAQSPQTRSPQRLEPTAKERLTGLLLIIIVAIIWIAASFIVQELRLHPFLITYICNSLFVVYIPVAAMQDTHRYVFRSYVVFTKSGYCVGKPGSSSELLSNCRQRFLLPFRPRSSLQHFTDDVYTIEALT